MGVGRTLVCHSGDKCQRSREMSEASQLPCIGTGGRDKTRLKSSERQYRKTTRGKPPAGTGGCDMASFAIPKHQTGPWGCPWSYDRPLWDKHQCWQWGLHKAMQPRLWHMEAEEPRSQLVACCSPRGCLDMRDGMRMCCVYISHTLTEECNRYQVGESQIY